MKKLLLVLSVFVFCFYMVLIFRYYNQYKQKAQALNAYVVGRDLRDFYRQYMRLPIDIQEFGEWGEKKGKGFNEDILNSLIRFRINDDEEDLGFYIEFMPPEMKRYENTVNCYIKMVVQGRESISDN